MSRFYKGGSSNSDSSSSSDNENIYSSGSGLDSDDQGGRDDRSSSDKEIQKKRRTGFQFLKGEDAEDSEEEDSKRVVKSAKDKRTEEFKTSLRNIENAQKINDWVTISSEFEKINKLIERLKVLGKPPRLYIRAIVNLDSFLNETIKKEKEVKKKMNSTNARALNSVKQRIRKSNKLYEGEIKQFLQNPKDNLDEFVEQETLLIDEEFVKDDVVKNKDIQESKDGFSTIGKSNRSLQFTTESILKHLRTVSDSRGKKNTDHAEQIRILEKLLEISVTPYHKIRVLLAMISSKFDYSFGTASYMSIDHWKSAEGDLRSLLELLENDFSYVVLEDAEEYDDDVVPIAKSGEVIKIRGSIVSFVDKLDDELIRSLQNIDPHTTDYIDRLKDETELYSIIYRTQLYLERINAGDSISRIIMRRLEHIYYKPEQVINILEETTWKTIQKSISSKITPYSEKPDAAALIHNLCLYLYKNGTSLPRTRAMLHHIYHHALHDKFYKARDMLFMSHLQDNIFTADIVTQILYNRTMVQIGLSAFRIGMISEAHSALHEICGTGRMKELLAQGLQIQRYNQVSPEQERLERQRQFPFHMHINLELLECVYLTCSMLLEIPSIASSGFSLDTKKVISRSFRRMLDYNERQLFTGPPENSRDCIMQASRALATGDWKKCCELIKSIKIWDLMPESQKIKDILTTKIQEEAVRTYLFTYSPFYETISIPRLSEMFDLPKSNITALVSKMISHEEISAALDQIHNAIIIRKVELSRLQGLALVLIDKIQTFIDQNEKLLEQKSMTIGNEVSKKQNLKGNIQTQTNKDKSTGHVKTNRNLRNDFKNGLGRVIKSTT
ncbi:hypothetical protein PNEG_00348 [Pneumocystis murina B123]|uniref:Eukaryotic translation initiation factor 3 subunit C n=1 Tax=Pneumocystis murina (strain B123) TaxID=1069680 RepID=M7PLJ9_PNEMU|nr:hypothetical protein PNEG_00348 [Pneumocystis murina B123]EMR11319.1 hypothetical protein PNEG_00348 [Pneumocystis murina B123]